MAHCGSLGWAIDATRAAPIADAHAELRARLASRWDGATSDDMELALEFLAFAEGRFLSIHPFRDFNGRTIRVFLAELLRRLDFPLVNLAPENEEARALYFAALEAADRCDWQPLIAIWSQRIAEAAPLNQK